MSAATGADAPLLSTALHDLHVELGAKMVPFAGYDMPVQYPAGILAEHLHTREAAGLFDVSHMGQVRIRGESFTAAAAALERLCPADFMGLKPGQQRYSFFTDNAAGILDDLMVTRMGPGTEADHLFMVVNAGCKDADIAHLRANLNGRCEIEVLADRSLVALQGPKAATVFARLAPDSAKMKFMNGAKLKAAGCDLIATRSGYTGEDGFEISVANADIHALTRKLLAEPEVKPIGLGARDSLRLEAGLCLYGNDITEKTNPVEASLVWAIQKRRREEGGFPGAGIVQRLLSEGPARRRVGILPEGKAPARAHTEITDQSGRVIGEITSGGFGPSLGAPVAMGYVEKAHSAVGTSVNLMVRGKVLPAKVAAMPFVPHRYHRG
ncbi:glycine cleavage system aminomethyltransferase GcvT [Dongia sp.]|uniref:glycine cleavage system aminomethyltransferase GcvT n=1 Tax=Dongia sp. TaxID=1977262 RepID=UPI0035AE1623